MNQQSLPDLCRDRIDSIDPIVAVAAVAATGTSQRSADIGTPTASSAAVTLQDVIDRLAGCQDLSARRRRDLISALRTLARLLGRTPDQVLAHLPDLRRALAGAGPATVDMSPKRLANVKSEVSFALKLPVSSASNKRRASMLSPDWRALSSACPTPAIRWRLSRFMHWCSAHGIEPAEADTTVHDRFIAEIDGSTLAADAAALRRQTVAAWALCTGMVATWPSQALGPPARRRGWAIGWSDFPATFQADVAVWISRRSGQDLLADDGPLRPLRPATLHHNREQVRLAASAMVRSGVPIADIKAVADVVTLDAVRTSVRWLLARRDRPTDTIHKLVTVLRSIARHYVRLPEQELAKLGDICRRVAVPRHGLTKKNLDRLRPFNDQRRMDLLLTLPHELMRRARSKGRPRCVAARDAQVAVAIEILLTVAPRIANLAGLRLGTHVLVESARPDRVVLALDEHETKNGSVIDQELPAESSRLLRQYVETYLPALGPPGGVHLFPGRAGGSMQPAALGKRVTAAIRAATGCEVNPHLMRHLGAKGHLDQHPGEYEVVRRVLGHKSIDTTTSFYTGFETGAAARHFDAGLLARRRTAEGRLGRRTPRS